MKLHSLDESLGQLPNPPKRFVSVAGVIPVSQRSLLNAMPRFTRAAFYLVSTLSRLSHQELRYPSAGISHYLCNGMDPMDVIHNLGFFGPLPTRVLTARVPLAEGPPSCPVTYVVLNQDRLMPKEAQERMAQRIPGVEVAWIDSCHQVMLHKPKELAEILLNYA